MTKFDPGAFDFVRLGDFEFLGALRLDGAPPLVPRTGVDGKLQCDRVG